MTTQQAADEQKAHQELLDNAVENREWIQNAQLNFLNVVKANPGLGQHPIFKMAMNQLQNGLGEHSMHEL